MLESVAGPSIKALCGKTNLKYGKLVVFLFLLIFDKTGFEQMLKRATFSVFGLYHKPWEWLD